MFGAIPDYELDVPAVHRYRDCAGIGVFDQTIFEMPTEPTPVETAEQTEAPVCEPKDKTREPLPPPPEPPAWTKAPTYDRGLIRDHGDAQEPALDRYRDFAGLLGDVCAKPEPVCR